MQRLQAYTYAVWAVSRSLATTREIAVAFFSCGYLDVSVPRVRFASPIYSAGDGRLTLHQLSDSEIPGSRPVSGSPELIAAAHVLHRLSTPRHSPYALISLTVSLRHERVSIETKVPFRNLFSFLRCLYV